ncbi:KGG domain-containing protein [Superficieibacter sp. 1612_C1]|uniref:KGG domain-containing protein n=1 Tax=Superficieibacter sp. 1612_C1 TaxID=2780382 RepID=UPI0018834F9C|nr:KGG domain-containing protein [Superficieibacter sp. 1612_C1]
MAEHRGGSGNFKDDPQKASEAGKKGGQSSSGGGGNFKDDPQKASEAGKKGGQSSGGKK